MAKTNKNKNILDLIKQAVSEVFREMGVITKKDLKYLPSKEEYFEREDKAMGELKKIRIEALENIHPEGKHATAIYN